MRELDNGFTSVCQGVSLVMASAVSTIFFFNEITSFESCMNWQRTCGPEELIGQYTYL